MNNRKGYLFALGQTPFNNTMGIDFSVHADIQSNAFGFFDSLVSGELIDELR
jgi:hypothetical protein